MKTCIVFGINSDLIQGLLPSLKNDYEVFGWHRDSDLPEVGWDLVIIALGKVSPVGFWWENDMMEWDQCLQSNLVIPFELLQMVWNNRKPEATVLWFTGSNPQRIMSGYSAYNASKMAVNKLVEQMDFETPDCRFIAFGPGYHATKIHKPTYEAQWLNDRLASPQTVTIEQTYKALTWCVENRDLCGGRNVCVSDVPFEELHENMFKLRRKEPLFQGLG